MEMGVDEEERYAIGVRGRNCRKYSKNKMRGAMNEG